MLYSDASITATELGLEDLSLSLYCDIQEETDDNGEPTGKMNAYLRVTEDFDFHRDHSPEYFVTDGDDPMLTADAEAALKKIVEQRYGGENFTLDDTGAEWFSFELVLTVDPKTTPEDLGVMFWERTKLLQFFNESDPGTFGSPYLFGSLIAEAMKA